MSKYLNVAAAQLNLCCLRRAHEADGLPFAARQNLTVIECPKEKVTLFVEVLSCKPVRIEVGERVREISGLLHQLSSSSLFKGRRRREAPNTPGH